MPALESNCINHTGTFNRKGHGITRYQGKFDYAHRVVLKKLGYNLKSTDLVHHICHNKSCVNPKHLEVKEWGQHSSDHNRGVCNSQAKLTESIVLEIRSMRKTTDLSYSKIAAKYNITKDSVVKICNRKTWSHI